jgi:tetratricopeptide (TPR) repeat protein
MIHCERCKTVNPSEQRHCQKCHRDLLPGEGILIRLSVLLISLTLTALGVWVLVRMWQGQSLPNLDCAFTSPVFWALLVVIAPISGLVYAIKPTPAHQKYLNRARRHLKLDQTQALADFNQAFELAPEKMRAAILKERASLYQSLGQNQQALRDQIASIQTEGAYQSAEGLAALAGMDKDVFAGQMKKNDLQALLRSKAAQAYGYCPKCRDVVELNEKMRCQRHTRARISDTRLAVPDDREMIRAEILDASRLRLRREKFRQVRVWLLVIVACIPAAYVLKIGPFAYRSIETPALDESFSESTDLESLATPSVLDESQAGAIQALEPFLFDQYGFSFEIPGDWQLITEEDYSALLNDSLKGMDASQLAYLGGAYTGGLGACASCGQVVIAVLNERSIQGELTEEQFQIIKQNQQQTMGERLISYEYVSVDGLPAAESHHNGRSGETRLWEYIIVPPTPGLVYLFSMSSLEDEYTNFEPVFQSIVATLQIQAEAEVLSPVVVEEDGEVKAIVLIEALNVRASPNRQAAILGSIPKGQEVLVRGKNAAGDWLLIYLPELGEGWVSAPLVSLRASLEELLVVSER